MPKRKLSSILKLEESFKRVLKEERKGRKLIPDPLCFCDCELQDMTLQALRTSLDKDQYTHQPLLTLGVPKNNFTIRPGAAPKLEDWITYDAFAYYIGRSVDLKLYPTVFSYRFRNGELLPGVKQWKKFENSYRTAFESQREDKNVHIIITDITSYFANINLSLLRNNLLTLLGEPITVNQGLIDSLFNNLLKPWAKGPIQEELGIPQGVDASSIIGNLFLHHVDAEISRIPKIKYFRYSDDIRVITQDKATAKKTLMRLISALSQIGLDVNSSKTQILNIEAAKSLTDPRAEEMELVEKLIRSKNRKNITLAVPMLKRILEGAFDKENKFGERHLSFALNRFALLRNELKNARGFVKRVSKLLISKLELLPGCTREFCVFFRNFPSSTYKSDLISFLQSTDNIYEWQEMLILDSLLRFPAMAPDDIEFFERTARDKNKHSLCRAKAILLMGKFGDQYVRHALSTMYKDESDPIVKRVLVFACQELAQAERSTFYDMVKADEGMKHTVAYVKKLTKPQYYVENEWTSIDIPDWGTY